ncbi:MAG: CRTAC1 family protein [Flavobacteriales bacterium]|nr:CRTAC1 family protein [Flavobacteriales bacterium]
MSKPSFIVASLALLCACDPATRDVAQPETAREAMRLEILGSDLTGISFRNDVIEDDTVNYFKYMYMYNGGGVAAGDLDGDSLPDLVFISNRNGGAVYRNLGDFRFQDVTAKSGFGLGATWATGVSMADVNADGHLDIHVCASGPAERAASTRRNLLFINDGKGHFTEQAAERGLDRTGHSTMAYFADLDGDVDLDCFIVGHRNDFQTIRQVIIDPRFLPVHDQSDRLYINDGTGHFTDRTVESGVASRRFGLAAAIGDVNGDGRNDIYVSNDFYSADQLLMNTGNDPKTGAPVFRDEALQQLSHLSYYSMGVDIADYNNDGQRDIYVVDMTPSDHKLNKENMASMDPAQFRQLVGNGFHRQYMVNTLHKNNGNGTWSEVGQMAGVDRTDWSWAPLFCDLDNDGWKDLFVTNGIVRDVTNRDFKNEVTRIAEEQGTNQAFRPILELAPSHTTEKMVFRNKGDLTFEKAMESWDYHQLTSSNGAATADLDRDGDLDLVTVDVNATVNVVRNHARENGVGHYLQLVLKGDSRDPSATGTSVTLYTKNGKQMSDLFPARGFQSSVEPIVHFGIGDTPVDSAVVQWSDHSATTIVAPQRDQRILVDRTKASAHPMYPDPVVEPMFTQVSVQFGLSAVHAEDNFDDFATETLLPQAQSHHGPCAAVADVDGNGTEDLFFGGSMGHSSVLYLQGTDGRFAASASQPWERYNASEFLGAHFFDADGDADADLYLAAGSTEHPPGDENYSDRLFMNDGKGRFTYADSALPDLRTSTMCVASNDLDGDGDLDLFVGGRNVPGAWPAPPQSHVLINDGGRFSDASSAWLAGNEKPGLITGAVFADMDGDKGNELVVCGEWMPIGVWKA